MNEEEILKAMYDIQCRYTMPYIKQNFTDKDYIILNYENLVIQIASKQDELGKKMFPNTARENKQLKERFNKAIENLRIGIDTYNNGGSRTSLFECISDSIDILERNNE